MSGAAGVDVNLPLQIAAAYVAVGRRAVRRNRARPGLEHDRLDRRTLEPPADELRRRHGRGGGPAVKHTLGDFPHDPVRVECLRCGWRGRYRKAGLIARFGADMAGADVLSALASCEKRKNYGDPCGARFTDLVKRP
jgi:hypothetical protein